MSDLTLEQMQDLLAKLNRLQEVSTERACASLARQQASDRWNAARAEYARLHAEIVSKYGEKNAPYWFESLHGPRAVHSGDDQTHE